MKPLNPEYKKVHSRTIQIDSHSAGEDKMIFCAALIEKRLSDYYLSTGERQPAGELHNLSVRLDVKIPEMLINSCYAWRKEGKAADKLEKAIAESEEKNLNS